MTRFRRHGLSRRHLLQSLGLGAAAAPLLPLMNASGQGLEGAPPKRLLLLYTPDGIAARDWSTAVDWRPTGTETDFQFHFIHEPLTAIKHKITVPWGLTLTAAGAGEAHAHGMAGLWTGATLNGPSGNVSFDGGNGHLTGWGSGASVDQLIAQASGPALPYAEAKDAALQETAYRTVELGAQPGNPTSLNRMIYSAANSPIHPESNALAAFSRLFAGVSTSPGEEPIDAALERTMLEQGAIVDLLKNDLTRIRRKVGSEDYYKLDAHLEGLLAIEQRLAGQAGGVVTESCSLPPQPTESGSGDQAFPQDIRNMMDITAHMLACDVTRIASLQMSYGFSYVRHSWLGHTSQHHTMSHDNTDRRQELQEIDNWYSQQVLYLLQKLDSFPEGNGSVLDNTLVVWGRELGTTAHRFERSPLIVAGGANLGVVQGRNLNFDGQKHAKLLVSIAQVMGLETTTIGDIAPNSGPLSGLVA
jgi:hypothetical protein